MKIKSLGLTGLLTTALVAPHVNGATVATSASEPTTNILVSHPFETVFTRSFDDADSRGQEFLTGSNPLQITALTIRHDPGGNLPAVSTFTLNFWDTTDVVSLATPVSTGTLLDSETVTTSSNQISDGDFVTFNLDTPFAVGAGRTVGFTIQQASTSPTSFQYEVTTGNQFTDGFFIVNGLRNNGNSNVQDIRFYIQGTVVPEPSATALLGLAALGLIRRRR